MNRERDCIYVDEDAHTTLVAITEILTRLRGKQTSYSESIEAIVNALKQTVETSKDDNPIELLAQNICGSVFRRRA